jgi:acid phosphatase family membrane protein YuiD
MPHYLYLLFPVFVWLVSQTIKFLISLNQPRVHKPLKNAWWIYAWAGGTPSTHTAVIVSSLVLVWHETHASAVFAFCFVLTLVLLYEMVLNRKKYDLLNAYYLQDGSPALQKMVHDGFVLDLSGHTATEVGWGIALGVALGFAAACLHLV